MSQFRRAGQARRARSKVRLLALPLAFMALAMATAPEGFAQNQTASAVAQGEYIFQAAGCKACHTDVENKGAPLAGGRPFHTPFGVFYSPNITPDKKTGIGEWTEAQFIKALREGVSPDGAAYYPVFPFPSYTGMRDADAKALYAYLMSLAPVERENQAHDLPVWFRFRFGNVIWKWLFFTAEEWQDQPDKSATWNRGGYIANALAHCGECHSPRNRLGAIDAARHLGGNPEGPEGDAIPNITPHPEDGIGSWDASELEDYLSSGMTPDSDFAGGSMAEVIDEGTSKLTPEDLSALVEYLMSVPALADEGE